MQEVRSQQDWKGFLSIQPASSARSALKDESRFITHFLDVQNNPLFRHALMRPFFVPRQGRVTVLIDERRNRLEKQQRGWLCFAKGWENTKVRTELLAEARRWARSRGMNQLCGLMDWREGISWGQPMDEGSKDSDATLVRLELALDRNLSEDHLIRLEKKKQIGELSFIDLKPKDLSSLEQWIDRVRLMEETQGPGFFKPEDWIYYLDLCPELKRSRLCFSVEYEGEMIGLVLAAVFEPKVVQLLDLIVHPRFTPQGVGELIELEFVRRIKRLGFRRLKTPMWPTHHETTDAERIERFRSLGVLSTQKYKRFCEKLEV